MRKNTHPQLYVCELTNIASGGGTASQQINFSESGVIRGITFAAQDSSGVEILSSAFQINIYRQNQAGLLTAQAIASTVCANAAVTSPYNLPQWAVGNFQVDNLDQLVVTVENNDGSSTATTVHVVFWLEADGV